MIKSLKIQNFQSHEKTALEFHNGVNIIVGSSDSGKTAIIRALRWVIWNRPSGDAIRSTWGGDTHVILETEDGYVWKHRGKEDKYELKLPDRAGLTFKAFGTTVPQEIVDILNINEINLQGQLDAPFLLSETPGAVAAHFNKVARLDKIDVGRQNVQSWIRAFTDQIAYKENDEARLQTELADFDYLDKFEADVEVLEGMESRKLNAIAARNRLRLLIINIKKAKDEQEQYKEILTCEPIVNKLVGLFADRAALLAKCGTLSRLLGNIATTKQNAATTLQNLKKMEVTFDKEMPDVCPLCGNKVKK